MLGVDYKNLSSEYFDDFRDTILGVSGTIQSYSLLEKLIEKMDDVLEYDYKNGGIIFNYYRIMIKCSIFETLSDFSRFNFGVINFNKQLYDGIFNGNTEKFLYVQSNEAVCPYFMMGILPDNKSSSFDVKYAVETLIAPSMHRDFFKDQEVVIPTQIITTTSDQMIKKEADPNEKLALINQYNAIVSELSIPNKLNIFGDYQAMLVEDSKKRIRTK